MKTDIRDNGFINLSNKLAECKISLWGGNIVSYRPKNQTHDVFWLGDLNKFDNIQAIRGGIPVCWPRVAEEKLNDRLPRHGFARISNWTVKNIFVDDKKMEVELSLIPDEKFGVNVTANLLIKITDTFEYQLETINNGEEIFEFSEALHAYFNIGSLDDVEIKGFANHQYKNSLDGKNYTLKGNIKIKEEFDAIFTNHTNIVEIVDTALNRTIVKRKDIVLDAFLGSGSTLIACEQTGRICYGVELDEKYCDVTIKRWENLTGSKAIRIGGING